MPATHIDAFAPATAMLAALRGRRISAVELLEHHLGRITSFNPSLNAIVTQDIDAAREAAEGADRARAAGEERPLLGLPVTIKDAIEVAGMRSTAGMAQWAEHRAELDAPLVARVRAAGAVIIGKTNVPPMLRDWTADNPVFGRTNNPWDLGRTPGGSTGGGAAAVAAGLTPLEYGTDISGSIRAPAAFCGVYGHKPSETALTRSGQFPASLRPNAATAMGVHGPLARSAADLELALDVVAGPDAGEDVAWRLQIPPARWERLAGARVAILPPPSWLPVDDEILAALERQAQLLSRAGAHVEQAQPEGFGDLRQHHETYREFLFALLSAGMPAEVRTAMSGQLRAIGDSFALASLRGLGASAAGYIELFRVREQYRAAYRAFFRDWDVLLAPATLGPAFPHPDPAEPVLGRTLEINGRSVAYDLQMIPAALATLAGQPATAYPAGSTASGLPIGLQAIGPYLEDRTPIRFAALIERECGGFQPPPGYGEGG